MLGTPVYSLCKVVTIHTVYFDSSCRNRVFDERVKLQKEYEAADDCNASSAMANALAYVMGSLYVSQFGNTGRPLNLKHITMTGVSSAEKLIIGTSYQGGRRLRLPARHSAFWFLQKPTPLKVAATRAACSRRSHCAHELHTLAHLTKLPHLSLFGRQMHICHMQHPEQVLSLFEAAQPQCGISKLPQLRSLSFSTEALLHTSRMPVDSAGLKLTDLVADVDI